MESKSVSKTLLRRLPQYLDHLKSLPENTSNISATTLARALGLGDVLVRKDLAKVSSGGRRKTGYPREKLIRDIEDYLDINSTTAAVIVGAGKLGRALLDYSGFENSGLELLAAFDLHPEDRKTQGGKPVYPVEELERFCRDNGVRIGIITVPAAHAQKTADRLIRCGIRGIWNFAPVQLEVPEGITVQSENLAVSLSALRMQLKNQDRKSAGKAETSGTGL